MRWVWAKQGWDGMERHRVGWIHDHSAGCGVHSELLDHADGRQVAAEVVDVVVAVVDADVAVAAAEEPPCCGYIITWVAVMVSFVCCWFLRKNASPTAMSSTRAVDLSPPSAVMCCACCAAAAAWSL